MKCSRNSCLLLLVFIPGLISAFTASAQDEIPLGSWRIHLSYNKIAHVEPAGNKIFAAGNSGVLVYNLPEQSLHTYNKLNGLSNTGISALKYDAVNDQVLVGYADGDLDIIQGNTVKNFSRLRDTDIAVAKAINHISIRENLAYLSQKLPALGVTASRLKTVAATGAAGTSC